MIQLIVCAAVCAAAIVPIAAGIRALLSSGSFTRHLFGAIWIAAGVALYAWAFRFLRARFPKAA